LDGITLREYQKPALSELLREMDKAFASKGPSFVGLEGSTGSGKTIVSLVAVFRHIRTLPPEGRPRVYAFVRTRSQMQSFLRDCTLVGIPAIGLPSKSTCCPNDVTKELEDPTELYNQINTAEEEIPEAKSEGAKRGLRKSKGHSGERQRLLDRIEDTVDGRCVTCPMNPLFYESYRENTDSEFKKKHAKRLGALEEYDQQFGVRTHGLSARFVEILKDLQDLDQARENFKKEFPYACPYPLVKAVLKNYPLIILTYPYILNHSIRELMFNERFLGNPSIVIMDEAHHMDQIKDNSNHTLSVYILKRLSAAYRKGKSQIPASIAGRCGRMVQTIDFVLDRWQNFKGRGSQRLTPQHFTQLFGDVNKVLTTCEYFRAVFIFISTFKDKQLSHKGTLDNQDRGLLRTLTSIATFGKLVWTIAESLARTHPKFGATVQVAHLAKMDIDPALVSSGRAMDKGHHIRSYCDFERQALSVQSLDYSPDIARAFKATSVVLMLSGTLPSPASFRYLFGISPALVKMNAKVGASSVLKVQGVTSKWGDRGDKTYRTYGDIVQELHKQAARNTLVVFTSNAFMNACARFMPPVAWYETNQTTTDLLEALRVRKKPNIYCIVAGSRLSEGVEFVNEEGLSYFDVSVICGIPLPPPTPMTDDQTEYLQIKKRVSAGVARELLSFEVGYQKVRQAFGRCVRGPKDSVQVFLADDRYISWRFWKNKFPVGHLTWEQD